MRGDTKDGEHAPTQDSRAHLVTVRLNRGSTASSFPEEVALVSNKIILWVQSKEIKSQKTALPNLRFLPYPVPFLCLHSIYPPLAVAGAHLQRNH